MILGTLAGYPFTKHSLGSLRSTLPSHPGYGKSDRPDWMRNVRDLAVVHQWLVKELKLNNPSLIGLGFGGWVAAEMASMSPSQ